MSITERDLGFFREVTVFKLLSDRQSEFRESSEPMYMLFYSMSTEKVQAIQKQIIYHKYESMQDCKIVTPESCVRISSVTLTLGRKVLAHVKN